MEARIERGKVSLVTPVYNTGNYISRLLDSILCQTYPSIELIAVNDGSTDNSATIIQQYVEKFNRKGYELKYLYQENQGQSVAVLNGLHYVTGEFVAWPDSDDYYCTSDAIQKMVDRLKSMPPDYAMVRTQENVVEDGTWRVLRTSGVNAKEKEDRSLFEDCLYTQNGFYFCPGAYMVYTEKLIEETDLDIYTSKNAGQNWQLYLPILFKYRCTTILEPLYAYVERTVSHSRGQFAGYQKLKKKYEVYEETEIETLKKIKGLLEDELLKHLSKIRAMYYRRKVTVR
jgi:glycosyltransferase involved in cell wall biosynthesis